MSIFKKPVAYSRTVALSSFILLSAHTFPSFAGTKDIIDYGESWGTLVPDKLPDKYWNEILEIGQGNPNDVIIFESQDGYGIKRKTALNVNNPKIHFKLTAGLYWNAFFTCMEKREQRNRNQDKILHIREANKCPQAATNQNELVLCLTDFEWNQVRRVVWEQSDPLNGTVNFDPVYHPFTHFAAYISQENGGYQDLRAVQVGGISEQKSIAWNDVFKHRFTTQSVPGTPGGTWEEKHPSWSPDGHSLVFTSTRTTGKFALWLINNIELTTRSEQVQEPNLLSAESFSATRPVWVKYRDLPTKNLIDPECEQAIFNADLYCAQVGCNHDDEFKLTE